MSESVPHAPPMLALDVIPTRSRARKPKREPSEMDKKAYAILSAAVDVVFEYVEGLAMSRKEWRTRNKSAALAFAEVGWTPERVVRLMTFAYTNPEAKRYYSGTTMLNKFQEYAPKLLAIYKRTRPYNATN